MQALCLALGCYHTEGHRAVHTHRNLGGMGDLAPSRCTEMHSGYSTFLASIPDAEKTSLAADIKNTEAGPWSSF